MPLYKMRKDVEVCLIPSLSATVSLPIVILILVVEVMIRISYIVITVRDLVILGRLASVSMAVRLEYEVVV